jgi:hypothetical protein
LPFALSQLLAISAPLSASVQAGPVSFIVRPFMARSRTNKSRRPAQSSQISGAWMLFGLLGLLAVLVLVISLTESIHLQLAAYGSFAISILLGWYVLKSGAFYIYGSPIFRKDEPQKFWIFFAISIVPLFLFSSIFIVIHLWSRLR